MGRPDIVCSWRGSSGPLRLLAALVLLGACDGSPGGTDASGGLPDGGGVDVGPEVVGLALEVIPAAAPAAPAAPAFGPCIEGFTATDIGEGLMPCVPAVAAEVGPCPPGQALFLRDGGCAPIGSECPAGAFPASAPPGTVFVSAAAAAGGDGTRDRPFRGVAAGLGAARPGDTVLVAAGDYPAGVVVPAGVTFAGVCPAEVRLTCPAADDTTHAITFAGDGVVVSNLTVSGCRNGVSLERGEGHSFRLENLVFDSNHNSGLRLLSGTGEVERVVIRDGIQGATGESGWGIGMNYGATVAFRDLTIERMVEFGVLVSGGETSATIENLLVRNMRPNEEGILGNCLVANWDTTVSVRGAFLDGCHGIGIQTGRGGQMTVEDFMVRRVLRDAGRDTDGYGFVADGASELVLRRGYISDTERGGGLAIDPDTSLVAEDLIVEGAPGSPDGFPAIGFGAYDGAEVTVRRAAIRDLDGYGMALFADSLATRLDAEDIRMSRLASTTYEGRTGVALAAGGAVEVAFRRVAASQIHNYGGWISSGVRGVFEDVWFSEIGAKPSTGHSACGLCGIAGADFTLRRVGISGVAGIGIGMWGRGEHSVLDASDLTISDSVDTAPWGGGGIWLFDSSATLERVAIDDVEVVAVSIEGEGTSLSATDILASNIGPARGGRYGQGVAVSDGASAALRNVRIKGSRGAGILAEGAEVTVDDIVIDGVSHDPVANSSYGILVQRGAVLTARNVEVGAATGVALAGQGEGTRIDATGVIIHRALDPGCDDCGAGGIGVGAYAGGVIELSDFLVTQNALCGVQVAGGEVDLRDGEVSWTPIGASVAAAGYDIDRLTDGVVYRDNGSNLDSTDLPVPTPGSASAGIESPEISVRPGTL